ncbi:ABC transporter substrate-binding protein [Desulfatibacillum aliphaticivorans]|uniref:ABC transporter substrate-binding protein n=1 Tax=Desulfatibacillum aliphaticivorans TaxID=218208 RepID=UPI0024A8D414|nr:ABC transporter substrate-binding protein [Desulfatibacillum aliphaticivorans]
MSALLFPDPSPPRPATARVGVLFPLTGPSAETGMVCRDAAAYAAETINAAGGVQSLGGCTLELVYGDTRSDPRTGAREVERLITQEGVCAVIGVYHSNVGQRVTEAAERLETPVLLSSGIADGLTERGFLYTFRIGPKARYYGRDQVRFLLDLNRLIGYSVRRVALIHENSAYGTSSALAQKRALQNAGVILAAEESYRYDSVKDMAPIVAKVLEAKPDAILMAAYIDDSILIAKALRQAGADIPVIGTAGGMVSSQFIKALGTDANGLFTVAEHSGFLLEGRKIYEAFSERYNRDLTGDGVLAYQCIFVLQDALERAGSLNKKRLRKALSETDMPFGKNMILPAPRLSFDSTGQNIYYDLLILQIIQGRRIPVWPENFAQAKVSDWTAFSGAGGGVHPTEGDN